MRSCCWILRVWFCVCSWGGGSHHAVGLVIARISVQEPSAATVIASLTQQGLSVKHIFKVTEVSITPMSSRQPVGITSQLAVRSSTKGVSYVKKRVN